MVNIDSNGRFNADIYTHFKKQIKLDEKRGRQRKSSIVTVNSENKEKILKVKPGLNMPKRPASTIHQRVISR